MDRSPQHAAPVAPELGLRLGSWASLLEPATTESLCEMGHGSLSVSEAGTDATDRWIAMDASWRELFEATTK